MIAAALKQDKRMMRRQSLASPFKNRLLVILYIDFHQVRGWQRKIVEALNNGSPARFTTRGA